MMPINPNSIAILITRGESQKLNTKSEAINLLKNGIFTEKKWDTIKYIFLGVTQNQKFYSKR